MALGLKKYFARRQAYYWIIDIGGKFASLCLQPLHLSDCFGEKKIWTCSNSENADMNTVVELMMTSYCFTFTVYQLMFNIHLIGYYLRIFTIYNNSQRCCLFCVQNLNKCKHYTTYGHRWNNCIGSSLHCVQFFAESAIFVYIDCYNG